MPALVASEKLFYACAMHPSLLEAVLLSGCQGAAVWHCWARNNAVGVTALPKVKMTSFSTMSNFWLKYNLCYTYVT